MWSLGIETVFRRVLPSEVNMLSLGHKTTPPRAGDRAAGYFELEDFDPDKPTHMYDISDLVPADRALKVPSAPREGDTAVPGIMDVLKGQAGADGDNHTAQAAALCAGPWKTDTKAEVIWFDAKEDDIVLVYAAVDGVPDLSIRSMAGQAGRYTIGFGGKVVAKVLAPAGLSVDDITLISDTDILRLEETLGLA